VNIHQRHVAVDSGRYYSEEDIDLVAESYAIQARENLWEFRKYMDDSLVIGWFPRALSFILQDFYTELAAGKRPMYVIEAPPQHGKTRNIQDGLAWMAGKNPDLKAIYASFSSDLGVSANRQLQRIYDDPKYALVFPDTQINRSNAVTMSGRSLRNSSLLEYVGRKGSFRNTTVNGQITGKTLDVGVIDDPLKGREAASSPAQRKKAWDWLMDDFFTRFTDLAGMILTATRWHVDDPTGRLLAKFPNAKVFKFPAVSTKPDAKRPYDLRRVAGVPLFPQFKSLPFLAERRRAATTASWESLYQQNPIVVGGGMFPLDRVKYTDALPDKKDIKKTVRYWDKAGSTDEGAYTAGVLMHALESGGWFIENVVRGQWAAFEREKTIKNTAEADAARYGKLKVEIHHEQEPGSGGKESAERTTAMLAGYKAYADRPTGKKEVRADPYAAQWQGGNITLFRARWNDDFLDEHEAFPSSKYKDQVDAASGAFGKCFGKQYNYDTSMKWAR
jgi:predicted phage terminase large subunit-like protein